MAEHFLDTETRHGIPMTALACLQSGLDVAAAESVWRDDVAAVVWFNIWSVAGEWAMWDRDWLFASIRRRRARQTRFGRWLGRTFSRLSDASMEGVWRSIAAAMSVLGDAPSSAREGLAQDLERLGRIGLDFGGEVPSDHATRERLVRLFPATVEAVFLPALVRGEPPLFFDRLRKALGAA